MKHVGCTYNLSYDSMSDDDWKKLTPVYKALPAFLGFDSNGCPMWYGREEEGRDHLWASVEPSGLRVEGLLSDDAWKKWDEAFVAGASAALGFTVKDAEA